MRGLSTVRSQLSPVFYRVARDGEIAETSVHLGRIKAYHNDASSSVPDFAALDEFLLGTLRLPDLGGSVLTVHIGPYTMEYIEIFNVTTPLTINHPVWAFRDMSALCLKVMRSQRIVLGLCLKICTYLIIPRASDLS